MKALRRFDFYRKVPVDFTEPTTPGAIISLLCGVFMVFLLVSEVSSFMQLDTKTEMFVQQEEGGLLRINFNITFPRLPCFVFSLDVLDVMGRHEVGVSQNIVKTRVRGSEVLGVLSASLTDADAQEQRNEGCNVAGYVEVNKVPGNFHVSAHGMHHMVQHYLGGVTDVSHLIHYFYAGETLLDLKGFPAMVRPLDGTDNSGEPPHMTYEYWFDVIPSIYSNPQLVETKGYQMTAHAHHFATAHGHMPAVYFRYQLSPITVKFIKRRKQFTHFLTYVCAIIGGVFTVAGLLNSLLQQSIVAFQKNVLGKSS